MIALTLWPTLDATLRGKAWSASSWDEVFDRLSQHEAFRGDFDHPGWSAAEFKPCLREAAHVESVSALCFDFDQGESLDAVAARLGALGGGFLHTTRKHAPERPRCRVVLPLARPVSAFEYPELWKRVAPVAGDVDQAAKDASRFWFLPGSLGPFEIRRWAGEWLDPSEWLKKPDPTARTVAARTEAPRGSANVEERARKYIARMPASISGAGGHAACWEVALTLARGFGLGHDRTLALLLEEFNPRCEPPWSERELEHKAAGAVKSERVPYGFLLKEDREWRPRAHRLPPPPADGDYVPEVPDDYQWEDPSEDPPESAEYESTGPEREPGDDSGEPTAPPTATERYKVVELRALGFRVVAEAKAGKKEGFTTGHYELNAVLCGLRPEHVTLLAAPTSWGKSSFGVMIADENIKIGVPVLVVSVEDSDIMYGKRIFARRANINAMKLRNNELSPSDLAKLEKEAKEAEEEPFLLNGVGKTVEYCAKAIRELVAERKIGIVICDYVQRFRTTAHAGDRRNQVTYVAETLSNAIKESKAAGVLLSQLKRTEGRRPTMDDVKESGDLENMAEHVLLGYRERSSAAAPWKRTLTIPKNKDGPTPGADIECPFNDATASFTRVDDPNPAREARLREANEWRPEDEDRRHP